MGYRNGIHTYIIMLSCRLALHCPPVKKLNDVTTCYITHTCISHKEMDSFLEIHIFRLHEVFIVIIFFSEVRHPFTSYIQCEHRSQL